jgi:CHAT domain-containing protein/lipopolysaccharide biosynthesis regulator YciM
MFARLAVVLCLLTAAPRFAATQTASTPGADTQRIDQLLTDGFAAAPSAHYVEMEQMADQALRLSTEAHDTYRNARALLLSGSALYYQSRFPEALNKLQRAEELGRQLNDIDLLKQTKQMQGNALRNLGRTDEALRDYDEWFRLNQQLPHPEPEGRTTRLVSILYREMGDTDKSEALARKALNLARSEGNSQLEAGCLLTLGALSKDRGRYSAAIPWHEQAFALAERNKLPTLQAEILNSWGDAEHHIGRLEQAEAHFRRAMDFAKSVGYLGLEAQATMRSGEVEMARGHYQDAIALYARASELYHQLGDPLTKRLDVEMYWARAERAAGHPEEALKHYREAIGQVVRLEELTVPTELARALPEAQDREAYEETSDLLMELNRSDQALEVADSGRARAFVDVLNESQIDIGSSLTSEERNREEELQRQVAAHRDQPPELTQALSRLEDFYLQLRRSNPAYAQLRRPGLASSEEVKRELADADTAFVEYMIGTARSFAWVVTSQGLHAVALPPRARLEPLLKSYRDLISQPVTGLTPASRERRERQMSRELYRLLIAPFEPALNGAKHLLIVPDGALAYLPFESLTDPGGRLLIEKRAVVYSQSASASLMLRALAQQMPPPRKDVLAVGDPVYGAGLAPIPYTREEATAVARLFPPGRSDLRLGAAANESALKRDDLKRFGYLHFAVHGLVDDSNPARSGLALSHLAGSAEDGILRADEIARLRLNAQLVVLSGCRTADGKLIEGEGLLTVSRSFYYAGAHNVVATLWNVDDASTTQFMKSFYRQIGAGRSPEDALQQAKLQMAHGSRVLWRNPWFWSPFVVFR